MHLLKFSGHWWTCFILVFVAFASGFLLFLLFNFDSGLDVH